jgi:penicillin-binding protein 1B
VSSLNLATVRLGLDLGVSQVLATVRRLGVERAVPAYPSALLGSVELAPVEVTQMYQTLASGGFRTPLRAIREVVDAEGQPLRRYPLAVRQTVDEGAVFLVNAALQGTVREGTAKALAERVPPRLGVAGKTGTTDGLRDSWFAGFTGNWLAVVWVGRDDNRPTGLTGATGALTVWAELFDRIGGEALHPIPPAGAAFAWVDRSTGLRCRAGWNNGVRLPFLRGTAPLGRAPDPAPEPTGLWSRLQGWFQRKTR